MTTPVSYGPVHLQQAALGRIIALRSIRILSRLGVVWWLLADTLLLMISLSLKCSLERSNSFRAALRHSQADDDEVGSRSEPIEITMDQLIKLDQSLVGLAHPTELGATNSGAPRARSRD